MTHLNSQPFSPAVGSPEGLGFPFRATRYFSQVTGTPKTNQEPIIMQTYPGLYYELSNNDSHQSTLHQVKTDRSSLGVMGFCCVDSKIGEFPYKSAL